MRNDSVGLFWDDTPPPKAPKAEALKRIPPEPHWLKDDYLPGLAEAQSFPIGIMTEDELVEACLRREELILDTEVYGNYFLAMFLNYKTGKVYFLEKHGNEPFNAAKLNFILTNFTTVGFNSLNYDLIVCSLALTGARTQLIKQMSDDIIVRQQRGSDLLRKAKVKAPKVDHIDLIEVAPLRGGLKTYAGRMHCPRMQDLPFSPDKWLTPDQITITRWYCVNDCINTAFLRGLLKEQIDLRYQLSEEYGTDVRSKSDAQIAEAVMLKELQNRTGKRPTRPTIEVGTRYSYNMPGFINFRSGLLQHVQRTVANADFIVDESGSIALPQEIKDLKIDINGSIYRMGIGGLHSSESQVAYKTDENYILIDKDVTSFYPYIIINQGLYPPHLGPIFLDVYRSIVMRRIAAKEAGNKAVADSLKIVINGSFGKFGSKYSILYAPQFLIQTTITGQLSILMLIEMLEWVGIRVVSANTDGIVIQCPRSRHAEFDAIVQEWERRTAFPTEETRYMALYSRDVNNYIAVKQKETKVGGKVVWIEEADGVKCKGAYANPWASKKNLAERLHKNPTTTICVEAVQDFLTKGKSIEETISASRDVTKFVTVRAVSGGAAKVWERLPPPAHETQEELLRLAGFSEINEDAWVLAGETERTARYGKDAYKLAVDMLSAPGRTDYLGKTIRWYYGQDIKGELVYVKTGNKVPRSDGAVPLMEIPAQFPPNVDLNWYVQEANSILVAIGAACGPAQLAEEGEPE